MKPLHEILAWLGGRATAAVPYSDDAEGSLFPADTSLRVALVTAFGIKADQLDTALDAALRDLPVYDKVICVVDQPDFLPLRRRGVPFEYLPPPAARSSFSDAAPWRTFLSERYEILLSKWRPTHVITAGNSLEQFLSGTP